MEEYYYNYFLKTNILSVLNSWTYIPVFWTNIQNHPNFKNMTQIYSQKLRQVLEKHHKEHPNTKYFTVVQHDDGILIPLPQYVIENLTIFGACKGTIPLPLIYEDRTSQLIQLKETLTQNLQTHSKPEYLASFVGSETHPIRQTLVQLFQKNPKFNIQTKQIWTNAVSEQSAENFIRTTLNSRFCLAPRGYGRSSFRFFESILLGIPPVYIWDDKEWLPYKNNLDYSTFSVSIHVSDLPNLQSILESISDETYSNMVRALKDPKLLHTFSLESIGDYIHTYLKEEVSKIK
jgi:hypothetical protein